MSDFWTAVTALWLPMFVSGCLFIAAVPLARVWQRWTDRPAHSDYVGIVDRAHKWGGDE